MKNKPVNYFLILIFLSILSSEVYGKCFRFNPTKKIKETPYIIKGIVVQSNKSQLRYNTPQEHNFTIKVNQVLKGEIKDKYLKVHYIVQRQKPTIRTFDMNATYTFAIKSIKDGNATLYGTVCGRAIISEYTLELLKSMKN